jgi:hypothetical protein
MSASVHRSGPPDGLADPIGCFLPTSSAPFGAAGLFFSSGHSVARVRQDFPRRSFDLDPSIVAQVTVSLRPQNGGGEFRAAQKLIAGGASV